MDLTRKRLERYKACVPQTHSLGDGFTCEIDVSWYSGRVYCSVYLDFGAPETEADISIRSKLR
jgi:hypothetical protein